MTSEQRRLAAIVLADVAADGARLVCILSRLSSASKHRKHLSSKIALEEPTGSGGSAVGGRPDIRRTSRNRRVC
jgi:hypothetical protein